MRAESEVHVKEADLAIRAAEAREIEARIMQSRRRLQSVASLLAKTNRSQRAAATPE